MDAPGPAFTRRLAAPATARELAVAVGEPRAEIVGDAEVRADGVASLAAAPAHALTFCDRADAHAALAASAAAIVVVPRHAEMPARAGRAYLVVADVRAAFIALVERLWPGSARPPSPASGIAADAVVDATARVAATAIVGSGARIGARTVVDAGAIVYAGASIGADCTIGPHAVIGHVGLAYHDTADGWRLFFPHLAGVRIGDRVDVGAQTVVCRGMLTDTVIDHDAKLGSLVYVSHGVTIGARAWISASCAIAGHAVVADDALLGIGAIVVDNVDVGPGVLVAGGGVVTRHAVAGERLAGVPAKPAVRMRRFGPTPRDRGD